MDPKPPAPAAPEPAPAPKGMMAVVRDKLSGLIEEYGKLAIFVYFGIFFLVWVSIALAIRMGWKSDSGVAAAGTWATAYLITKATQPLRVGATLVITPALDALWKRLRGHPPGKAAAQKAAAQAAVSQAAAASGAAPPEAGAAGAPEESGPRR